MFPYILTSGPERTAPVSACCPWIRYMAPIRPPMLCPRRIMGLSGCHCPIIVANIPKEPV